MLLPAIAHAEQRRLLRFFLQLPGILGAAVALIGAAALAAWGMGWAQSTSGSPTSPLMVPLTAACFCVSGLSVVIAQWRDSKVTAIISRVLALVVALAGMLVLLEYGLGWHLNLDKLWFTDPAAIGLDPTRRMAINTAFAFVLFGQGLMFLHGDRKSVGLRSQYFATLVLIVALMALIGHIFGVEDFYRFQLLSGMAVSTAITFMLLGLALLFSQLERGVPALIVDDGAAGFVARRLLPGAVIVPFVLTTLRFMGEERNIFGQRLGASLVAVADMVAFLLLIAWSARVLREIDRKRGELFVLEREAHDASEKARAEAEVAMQQAEAARAEAESANGAKSDFLAVMSHELRTPLAAIMGYQELLADGITGPITEAQAQQLGRIKASARHLLSLIDEILTFTRLDAGRESVILEPMDLDGALREAAELVEPLSTAKKLELNVESPGPGVTIESDPTKIRQILVNLMSNAVKFTDSGSVTARGIVTGKEVHLAVTDTGIGIPSEHLNRIFDPFWQVEQKATRRATGTGLGLTVTKRLANLLGGDVVVTSTVGEGTTFTVMLPRNAPHVISLPEREAQLRAG